MNSSDKIAEVNSESETEIGRCAEQKTYRHKDLGADLFHDETVNKAAEAIYQGTHSDDDSKAGVRDAVLCRKPWHRDGKILSYKIVDGVHYHRYDDGVPLPRLETSLFSHYS